MQAVERNVKYWFHQYQQKELWPQITEHVNKNTTYGSGNPDTGLGQAHIV